MSEMNLMAGKLGPAFAEETRLFAVKPDAVEKAAPSEVWFAYIIYPIESSHQACVVDYFISFLVEQSMCME
jgi:hypothetical protein